MLHSRYVDFVYSNVNFEFLPFGWCRSVFVDIRRQAIGLCKLGLQSRSAIYIIENSIVVGGEMKIKRKNEKKERQTQELLLRM